VRPRAPSQNHPKGKEKDPQTKQNKQNPGVEILHTAGAVYSAKDLNYLTTLLD
jgi:hypothetical protein